MELNSELLPRVVYILLLVLLVGIILQGPTTKFTSRETTYREDFKSPSELPAPTVTICKMGAKRRKSRLHNEFYRVNDDDGGDLGSNPNEYGPEQFSQFREYYRAAYLMEYSSYYYVEPLWAPKPSEWRATHSDTFFIGDCYNLDLSEKIAPGKPWLLNLAFQETEDGNGTSSAHGGYMLLLREKGEDFLAGITSQETTRGTVLQEGHTYTLHTKPRIVKYLRDCDDGGGTLTECVDKHVDLAVPACTAEMSAGGRCGAGDLRDRIDRISHHRAQDYLTFKKDTSCHRKCLFKFYDVDPFMDMETESIFEVEPGERKRTIVYLRYDYQNRIRYLREEEIYTFTDFQADIGGLSGLLLGLSVYDLCMRARRALCCGEKARKICNKEAPS